MFRRTLMRTCLYKIQKRFMYIFLHLDVNECSLGLHNCSEFSVCVNTFGGYTCKCNTGYKQTNPYECEGILAHVEFTITLKYYFICS